jgi:hypothetical protein
LQLNSAGGLALPHLLDLSAFTAATGSAVALIARRTEDRSRDIDDAIRERTISRLMALGIDEEIIHFCQSTSRPTGGRCPQLLGIPAVRLAGSRLFELLVT